MSGRRDPGLAGPGPLLDQLGRAFARLDWVLPAGSLADGVPPRAMHPQVLRAWLLSEGTGYAQRDAAWAAVVDAARGPGPDAAAYRLLAVGLAGLGLGGWRRRIPVVAAQDVPDVHADLVVGFFTRLATIDTGRGNIAGRLVDSAISHAAARSTPPGGRAPPGLAGTPGCRRPCTPPPPAWHAAGSGSTPATWNWSRPPVSTVAPSRGWPPASG